jgi:hypothetical protein
VGKVRVNMQYGPAAPRPAVEPELPPLAEPEPELPLPPEPLAETITPALPAEAESPLAAVPDILPETVADEDDLASPSQLEEAEAGLEEL